MLADEIIAKVFHLHVRVIDPTPAAGSPVLPMTIR
jgi:hypothetical protein